MLNQRVDYRANSFLPPKILTIDNLQEEMLQYIDKEIGKKISMQVSVPPVQKAGTSTASSCIHTSSGSQLQRVTALAPGSSPIG